MITQQDQLALFTLLGKEFKQNITCYAFGGTAMMFYGYKDETKDIDLLFENEEERKEFIRVLTLFGYTERSAIKIYIPEKLRDPHRPLMYQKDDIRFDLFSKKIFKTLLSIQMQEDLFAVHEFKGKYTLQLKVLRKEHLVLLKAVTDRATDFDDIKKIISLEKNFDWQYFLDEVAWQFNHGNTWALLDVEKMMQELKKYTFIQEKYFKQLYGLDKKKKKSFVKKEKPSFQQKTSLQNSKQKA